MGFEFTGKNGKGVGQPWWYFQPHDQPKDVADGYRFTLKGSPRHYEDVRQIIEDDPGAQVYFGEALTYERGAAVALWRISARSLLWINKLYAWWAETERVEPVLSTFYLYMPSNLKYPVMDLREHTPDEVIEYIKANAPRTQEEAAAQARRT